MEDSWDFFKRIIWHYKSGDFLFLKENIESMKPEPSLFKEELLHV